VAEQSLSIGVITKPAHTTEHDFRSEALHLAASELDIRFWIQDSVSLGLTPQIRTRR